MTLRVLSWNLYHGRAVPPAGRALKREFAAMLAGWRWDVALLQEVQPWWGPELGRACSAQWRQVMTSRNSLLVVRRLIAERWPDWIGSNGGGANVILVRAGRVVEHRRRRVRWRPERRWVHAVRLESGLWVANMHLTVPREDRPQRDLAAALEAVRGWAGEAPMVFGGDVNQVKPRAPGLEHVAAHHVDHLFVRGLRATGPAQQLEHGALSDHAPLAVDLAAPG